jgi:hypothetical protein
MLALFFDHSLVLVMHSNPEPNQSIRNFDRKGTIVNSDSRGAVSANLFEVQGRMSGVCFQPLILFIRHFLNIQRQLLVVFPE